jgi:hypothetical protein
LLALPLLDGLGLLDNDAEALEEAAGVVVKEGQPKCGTYHDDDENGSWSGKRGAAFASVPPQNPAPAAETPL